MILFIYDKTLDGLLTALFDAYNRKTFPDVLLSKGDTLPEGRTCLAGIAEEDIGIGPFSYHLVLAFRVTGSRYAFVPIHPKGH